MTSRCCCRRRCAARRPQPFAPSSSSPPRRSRPAAAPDRAGGQAGRRTLARACLARIRRRQRADRRSAARRRRAAHRRPGRARPPGRGRRAPGDGRRRARNLMAPALVSDRAATALFLRAGERTRPQDGWRQGLGRQAGAEPGRHRGAGGAGLAAAAAGVSRHVRRRGDPRRGLRHRGRAARA